MDSPIEPGNDDLREMFTHKFVAEPSILNPDIKIPIGGIPKSGRSLFFILP